VVPGEPLKKEYVEENLELLAAGIANLEKHIQNTSSYGIPVFVAVNTFSTDTPVWNSHTLGKTTLN